MGKLIEKYEKKLLKNSILWYKLLDKISPIG